MTAKFRFYVNDFDGSAEHIANFLEFPNADFANRGERDQKRNVPRRNNVSFTLIQTNQCDFETQDLFVQELLSKEDKLKSLEGEVKFSIAIIFSDFENRRTHLTFSRELISFCYRLDCKFDVFLDSLSNPS